MAQSGRLARHASIALMLTVCAAAAATAQTMAAFIVPSFAPSGFTLPTSSAQNPVYGSITNAPATAIPVKLSLTDAVNRGLQFNLALEEQQQVQRESAGQKLSAFNALMPDLSVQAQTGTQSIYLPAMGISPGLFASFHLPPGAVPTLVKVDVTGAQINVNQPLFNMESIELYHAAKATIRVAELNTLNTRGDVVMHVSSAYLQTLAAESQLQQEQALLRADATAYDQAKQKHAAGVATRLDELRGQVQYQEQEQAVVRAENSLAKDRIALNRMIGLAADQPVELTDITPFSELTMLSLDEAKATAYARRKDYLALQAQLSAAGMERKAATYERLPSLSFGGYYGVIGATHGLYHGVFTAAGSLNIPIFHEAQFRGDREAADAQLNRLHAQVADLQATIESQLRASMLDVQATSALVKVGRSNVDLAQQELQDSSDRFAAGIEDNLPLVQAQATLASAQTQMVDALYQYNQAKLNLARVTGVIELQYTAYLGQ